MRPGKEHNGLISGCRGKAQKSSIPTATNIREPQAVFRPSGVVLFGLDDTIERRRGEQITAKGIYRDPVRSSHAHMVKASGLRWLGCMLLTPISWANRVWALPFLTVLCPSERFYEQRGRRHHTF